MTVVHLGVSGERVLRRLIAVAASGVDRTVAHALVGRRLAAASPRMRCDQEWPDLERITAGYDRADHYRDPDTFFGDPGFPQARSTLVRRLACGGRVIDASWPSCAPLHPAMVPRHHASPRSQRAAARLFVHPEPPRGAVILVHGYLGGTYALEERLWSARRLHQRGFDVALATLPFHGVRAEAGRSGRPSFPAADPRITNEGVRQAVFDLRGLIRLLRARGAPRVGAMGMSLGGYVVSLLATVERELAFVVPVVPLADLTAFSRGHVPDTASHAEVQASMPARARAHRVVSPLARRSVLSSDRVLVVGAAADRIAPLTHAQELADHFGAPLEIIPGGHLLQLGRGRALSAIDRLLDRCCETPAPCELPMQHWSMG